MAAQHQAAAVFNQFFDGGQRRHDAVIVGDDAVLHGHVEIAAHQHVAALYVQVFHRFLPRVLIKFNSLSRKNVWLHNMHRASGPAYTFIIVGFGLFRKCFRDNFFHKEGRKILRESGRAAAEHPPQPCTGRAGRAGAKRHRGTFLRSGSAPSAPLRRQGQVLNFLKVWRAGKVIFGRNKGIHRAAAGVFHRLAVLARVACGVKLVGACDKKALRRLGKGVTKSGTAFQPGRRIPRRLGSSLRYSCRRVRAAPVSAMST